MKQDVVYREDVLANRIGWCDYLEDPGRKKAIELLDAGGGGYRCCLGHGCVAIGMRGRRNGDTGMIEYGWRHVSETAPDEFVETVGLWDDSGSTRHAQGSRPFLRAFPEKRNLAAVNDETDLTPQQIGAGLRLMVEGGDDTPFRPLTDYPVKP